jgi:hypothetical protein
VKPEVEQRLAELATLVRADPEIQDRPFTEWRQISSRSQGVYVIYSEQEIIYVGKGQIRSRQDKHWQKALADFRSARDTVGWRWLRENTEVLPEGWRITTVSGLGHTARAAYEGMLIHWLQPLANDEVFLDR